MTAALAVSQQRFGVGQKLLLKRPAYSELRVPAREPLPVTLRGIDPDPRATGEDHVVCVDEGLLAGVRLWVHADELVERPRPPQTTANGRARA